jgi:hypothetical protein
MKTLSTSTFSKFASAFTHLLLEHAGLYIRLHTLSRKWNSHSHPSTCCCGSIKQMLLLKGLKNPTNFKMWNIYILILMIYVMFCELYLITLREIAHSTIHYSVNWIMKTQCIARVDDKYISVCFPETHQCHCSHLEVCNVQENILYSKIGITIYIKTFLLCVRFVHIVQTIQNKMIQKVWKNIMTKLIHCTTQSRNRIGGGV